MRRIGYFAKSHSPSSRSGAPRSHIVDLTFQRAKESRTTGITHILYVSPSPFHHTDIHTTMADTVDERKPRKSVAFADGQTIVDSNGEVTEQMNGQSDIDGEKDSAESHSGKAVDDASEAFDALTLGKKKKKKTVKKEDDEEEAEKVDDDGEVDLSALKKKKKKKTKTVDTDDFEAKLAEAGATDDKAEGGDVAQVEENAPQEGDLFKGTGVWAHDSTAPINYSSLLSRFFTLLHDSHGDLGGGGMKSYKIPPPQCLREGNKKTIFANIAEICKRMKRTDEHVRQFLFAELGTSGSVDGSKRLVIKGRFQQKQIENVLRRYIGKCHPTSFLPLPPLTSVQSNTSHARPAAHQIPNLARERTDCLSSLAIHVVQDVQSLLSRLVSLHKSARERDSRVKLLDISIVHVTIECSWWQSKKIHHA